MRLKEISCFTELCKQLYYLAEDKLKPCVMGSNADSKGHYDAHSKVRQHRADLQLIWYTNEL